MLKPAGAGGSLTEARVKVGEGSQWMAGVGVPGCGGEDRRAQLVSSPRSLRPRGRDANMVREEIGSMGVHELD